MSNFKFSGDLVDDALFRVGEPIDGTSDFNAAALRYINKAYQAVWMGGREIKSDTNEKWWWLRNKGVLNLDKIISNGSVSVINDSASITFSTAPTLSVAGFFFKVNNNNEIYVIQTHNSGSTSATLDSIYNGTTNSAGVYELFRLDYSLNTDLLFLISPMRKYVLSDLYNQYKVFGGDLEDMERDYPLALILEGVPDRFALIGDQKVRFNKKGSKTEKIRIEYDYIFRPADLNDSPTEEPVIPFVYRSILSDYAAYLLAVDKNDDRAQSYLASAQSSLVAMVNENRSKMRNISIDQIILPRRSNIQNNRILRTQSGLIIG